MQQTIGNMTLDELKDFIYQVVNEQRSQPGNEPYQLGKPSEELWQSIVHNLIKQEPGVPSPLEMLREEREKWYRP